jgi:hypothetical protein
MDSEGFLLLLIIFYYYFFQFCDVAKFVIICKKI